MSRNIKFTANVKRVRDDLKNEIEIRFTDDLWLYRLV